MATTTGTTVLVETSRMRKIFSKDTGSNKGQKAIAITNITTDKKIIF